MDQQKQAIDALGKSYKSHDAYVVGFQTDPLLSPLRSDPHLQDVVRRMDFPVVSRPAER